MVCMYQPTAAGLTDYTTIASSFCDSFCDSRFREQMLKRAHLMVANCAGEKISDARHLSETQVSSGSTCSGNKIEPLAPRNNT